MAIGFEMRGAFKLAVIWVVLQGAGIGVVHADLIGDLCNNATEPSQVIEALVEEAEATGMPPATLNRLLAVGYRNDSAIVDLRRILCTIVIMEERGLPPEPLFRKVEEGLGKRVDLNTIHEVILRQAEKLQYAQTLVAGGREPRVDDDNVKRVADLLEMGVSRQDLDHLFGPAFQAPTDMRVVAAEIVGYGTMVGFPRNDLNRIAASGLKFRSLSPEWTFFIKVVKEARAQGISDDKTALAAIRTLSDKESMDRLIAFLKLDRNRVYDSSESK